MDILTGGVVVGAAYILVRRETAKPAKDTQPESKGPVIPNGKSGLSPAQKGAATGLGAVLGGLLGAGAADFYLDVTAGYNAPTTKAIAVPALIGVSTLGGAIVVFVGITYGAIAAGYAGLIVIAVLALVFTAFVIAANVEDVDRWNAFVFHKQIVVKQVAAGNYMGALALAQQGAKGGIPGLGFYLSANHTTVYYMGQLYYKTAFDASPKIPAPGGHGGLLGRGGLDKDYYFPEVVPYEYATYFGKDGGHMFTMANGHQVNLIDWLQAMYAMQRDAYVKVVEKLGKPPTWNQWMEYADKIHDQNGVSLREWIALHDAVGAHIQPARPWLDMWLLQSPEFDFDKGPVFHTQAEKDAWIAKNGMPPHHQRTYATNDYLFNLNNNLSSGYGGHNKGES